MDSFAGGHFLQLSYLFFVDLFRNLDFVMLLKHSLVCMFFFLFFFLSVCLLLFFLLLSI